MNSILIAQPVATFHCVISRTTPWFQWSNNKESLLHVVKPTVFFHVGESSIDTALSSHGVRSRWEQFGDNGGFVAFIRQTKGGSEASSSRAHNHAIVLVIDNFVLLLETASQQQQKKNSHLRATVAPKVSTRKSTDVVQIKWKRYRSEAFFYWIQCIKHVKLIKVKSDKRQFSKIIPLRWRRWSRGPLPKKGTLITFTADWRK